MTVSRFVAVLAGMTIFAVPASAADLTKVDRKIAVEPAYRSKPKYCMLVFGPQARTQVWLILDDDTLYVDRNGNGDLTEASEKVPAAKSDADDSAQGIFTFEAGDVRDGELTHKGLTLGVRKLDHLAGLDESVKAFLAKNPKGRGYAVAIDVAVPGRKGAGKGGRVEQIAFCTDAQGVLQFADQPQDAPIIHFGGPWQVTLWGRPRLTLDRETDLTLGVGTPGLGAGTTAYIGYDGVIPEKVYPSAELTYPAARNGEPPVRELYELKARC
jgi:hypothetical protein